VLLCPGRSRGEFITESKNMEEQPDNLEIEKKEREIEKLKEEITTLRRNNSRQGKILQFLPFATAAILLLGFLGGLATTYFAHSWEVEKQKDLIKARKEEIDKQNRQTIYVERLKIFSDLVQTAGEISAISDENERQKRYAHFRSLYDGNIKMLDSEGWILEAAKRFDDAYLQDPANRDKLREEAQNLGCVGKLWIKNLWGVPVEQIVDCPE
jgi:hypothetical protein